MKKYNFNETDAQYAALDQDEMMTIDGGGAYEVGHAIGQAIHDVIWNSGWGRPLGC